MAGFVHLHAHSQYSLLDGYASVEALVKHAKDQGCTACALTDHGMMAGAAELVIECKKQGLKPIVGCEIYLALNEDRSHRPGREDMSSHHLVLLAASQAGLENLYQIVSDAHLNGTHFRPRTNKEMLRRHAAGLVALSACMAGEVQRVLLTENADPTWLERQASQVVESYREIFGERFYLEVQSHPGMEFQLLKSRTIQLARKLGVPLVATNDVHYISKDDHEYQTMLSAIGHARGQLANDYHAKSMAEMLAEFQDAPDAVANAQRIADLVEQVKLPTRVEVPLAPELRGREEDINVVLAKRCWDGLRARLGDSLTDQYRDQLRYELEVVRQTGFASYMLMVQGICKFMRDVGIRYGPRGSAAGSVVCWSLFISEPDPIANELVFERFLNPERLDMPDIDLDIQDDRRHEVLAYLSQTYGEQNVAQVATYGTLGAKAAIKDVARLRQYSYQAVDMLTKAMGKDVKLTLESALENSRVQDMLDGDPALQEVYSTARHLEGVVRHASTHAAGAVVAAQPLTTLAPLMRVPKSDGIQVQFPGDILQKAGLLKMDLLGLDNLTVLSKTVDLIREQTGQVIDVWRLPLDDARVYDMLCKGRVYGVFQLGTEGGKQLTVQLQPRSLEDLSVLVALNRPGPDSAGYLAVRNGEKEYESPHPLIDPIVRPTFGVIVYQEQILDVAKSLAGFSYGRADVLRRAVGKKIAELMASMHVEFVQGCQSHSKVSAEEAEDLWQIFVPFSNYGFNRAHSVSYAFLAYQTAYLKCHYPVQFMCAVLDVGRDNQEKIAQGVAEAKALGIRVLPPSVERSSLGFTVEWEGNDGAIRFGLGAVKGVGEEAVRVILERRPFQKLSDIFLGAESKVPRQAVEALAKVGALESLGPRQGIVDVLPRIVTSVNRLNRIEASGQLALWDVGEQVQEVIPEVEAPLSQRLLWEREGVGVYLSRNPVTTAAAALGTTPTAEVEVGDRVTIVGELRNLRILPRRSDGKLFAAGTLADDVGSLAVVAFTKVYERDPEAWYDGALVILRGQVNERDGERQLVVDTLTALDPDEYAEEAEAAVAETTTQVPIEELVFHVADPGPWLEANRLASDRPGIVGVRLVLDGPRALSVQWQVGASAIAQLRSLGKQVATRLPVGSHV